MELVVKDKLSPDAFIADFTIEGKLNYGAFFASVFGVQSVVKAYETRALKLLRCEINAIFAANPQDEQCLQSTRNSFKTSYEKATGVKNESANQQWRRVCGKLGIRAKSAIMQDTGAVFAPSAVLVCFYIALLVFRFRAATAEIISLPCDRLCTKQVVLRICTVNPQMTKPSKETRET